MNSEPEPDSAAAAKETAARVAAAKRAAAAAEFSIFHQAMFTRLRRYASRILRRNDAGHDIAQEALKTVWEQWNSIKPEFRRAIAYRITHNKAVSEIRRLVRTETMIAKLPETPPTSDYDAATELAVIEDAIASLPPRQQAIMLLTKAGLEPWEVAEVLGIKSTSVHEMQARIRAELRVLVGRHKRKARPKAQGHNAAFEGGANT
ncbi:RNA polymerase sigma factor [Amycolatopsis lurida]